MIFRFIRGYALLAAIPLVAMMVLKLNGASWYVATRSLLGGVLVYIVLLVAITYQFTKELRAAEFDEQQDTK
ncbi:hypothetical protein BCY88_30405 [Paraburkholderia fungorum]|uniref:Uncharacterized protein n=1 Tax=Paraburkholderia fungorum TaxID=134537 RepID=A0A3R7HGC4_9BURK|nr:hypothetical protein BCY88_30405 [Paraburkholderia fungorum]